MNAVHLTGALKKEAERLGFDLVGACPAVSPPGIDRFRQWLADGYVGEMRYLADRAAAYEHPRSILDGVRSIVMLAKTYRTVEPLPPAAAEGRIARYAWGADYHDLIHRRLKSLARFHRELVPNAAVRGVVDTAPLLEREFAQMAGLGWIGKNTMLLNPALGSWFFLAALLTSEPLEYDEPYAADHCGACRACLDACPTGALVEAHRLDARRCISYLTIELQGPVPGELRGAAGDWLFGCDICQEVCPWNNRAPVSIEAEFQPAAGTNPAPLAELFALDDAAFRERFRHTPLWRAKRRGLLRNAAIILGSHPSADALPALVGGLNDVEPLVRSACAWALGRYSQAAAGDALRVRRDVERDPEVQAAIRAALSSQQ
jgi:epoxyqueuosine reductase